MEDKFLTDLEIAKLEMGFKDQEIARMQIKMLEKDALILKAKKEILDLKKVEQDLEILKTQIKIDDHVKRSESLSAKAKEFNNYIKEKYEIEGKWGFDPDSGRIIEGG